MASDTYDITSSDGSMKFIKVASSLMIVVVTKNLKPLSLLFEIVKDKILTLATNVGDSTSESN